MYEEALAQFNRSLQLNPSNAPVIYNHRARVYQYQNQLELAEEELQKGLTLEPKHSLLRTSLAYQHMRKGELQKAIAMLETVIREDDSMRIAFPDAGDVLCAGGGAGEGGVADRRGFAFGGGGGQRDGVPAGDVLRGGRR